MKETVFREYDIRGRVPDEFNLETVYELGSAIAYYFLQQNKQLKTVAVAMDGRTHCPLIKENIVHALQDSGLDVIFIGICPSPVLYFALHTLPVDAGIMITASHNPKEYNGLKLSLGKESLSGTNINQLKQLFFQKKQYKSNHRGTYTENFSVVGNYCSYLEKQFSHLKNMPLSAVVDCGNGTAGAVLPLLLERMRWQQVQLLYPEIDGSYPNHEADPVVEQNMNDVKKIVLQTPVEIGVGLDGDADRMAAMTKEGYLIPGDQLLLLFAQSIITKHPGLAVVCDIKSSSTLLDTLKEWGGISYMVPSGHAIIKKAMKEKGALLAGELSCHFIFNDRYYAYDDGIYAMLRLFEIIIQSGKTLSELIAAFPKKISTNEMRIACCEQSKQMIIKQVHEYFLAIASVTNIITIDGVRVTLDNAWGIIRASNTQPVMSLRFESSTTEALSTIVRHFKCALQGCLDTSSLEIYL